MCKISHDQVKVEHLHQIELSLFNVDLLNFKVYLQKLTKSQISLCTDSLHSR